MSSHRYFYCFLSISSGHAAFSLPSQPLLFKTNICIMWILPGSIWSENNVEIKAFVYFTLFMRVANCSTSVSGTCFLHLHLATDRNTFLKTRHSLQMAT